MSGINSTIVRVRERRELFREACRIAVQQGGFRMAWVGVVEPGAAIRTKSMIVANDIEADPHVIAKREALARGYRSMIAMPLLVCDQSVGGFGVVR